MNKKFTKLMAALALLTFLAVPMGMRGQSTVTFDATTDITANASSYQNTELTINAADGSTWKAQGYGATANTNIIIGKGGANYLETPIVGGDITSVAVTWSGNTSYYLALQTTTGTELEAKSNPSTSTTETFNVSGSYTQLRLVGRRSSGTSNAAATITRVVVTYSSGSQAAATTTTISDAGITNTDVYAGTAAGSLSATVTSGGNAISGATVTWSGNNNSVATIDASTGAVTLVAAGTVTFTATYAGVSGTYQGSSATYEMTVIDNTPYVQPTIIEITPNFTFWGKTQQFSGNDFSELEGSKDNVTLNWTKGNGSTYANTSAMRFYKDNDLTFTAPEGYEIISIVLAVSGTYSDLTFSPTGFDNETTTWTGAAETVTMSRPSNASSYAAISKFTITLAAIGNAVATTTTINVPQNFNTDIYQGTTAGTLTATVKDNDDNTVSGATVTWSSSNTGVATIDANGEVTLVAVGTTTITANYAGVEDEYRPSEGTYELTVTDSNAPGTQNNPYTVAQAIAATPSSGNVYIQGVVSSFYNTSIMGDGSNFRYYISDDGGTTTQLLVYKGKGLNQVTFSNVNDLLVGDEVVICGTLIMYNSAPEINSGNYLYSWNRPTYPIINANDINLAYDATSGSIPYSITNPTSATLNATSTADWISNITVGTESVTFTTTANEGDADRSATITLSYEGATDKVITVTQAEFVPDYVVLPFNWEGGTSADLEAINGVTVECDPTDYAASNAPYRVKFNVDGYYILVKTNDQPAVVSVGIKKFAAGNTSSLVIQGSSDGDNFTDVQTFSITGAQNATFTYVTTNAFAATDRYVRIYFNKPSDGSNVGVGPITIRGLETHTLTIEPYTVAQGTTDNPTNGWYLISSPVIEDITPSVSNGFITNTYDLYRFNQSGTNGEWENYHQHNGIEDPFMLENGKGYLYANSTGTTLIFTGTSNTNSTQTVNLGYTEGMQFAGFNLVGNPFPVSATSSMSYYVMNSTRTGIEATPVSTSTAIDPYTGVFVEATGANQTVTFTKQTQSSTSATNNNGYVNLVLSQEVNRGIANLDKAIVSFNEGDQLSKFYFGSQDANLYIAMSDKDYAIVSSEAQGEMPVSFRANEDGQYTLTVNPEGVEMNYLHLVDNMTGMDVDLLQTPSYTFNAKTTDYESRFRLVFAANNNNNEDCPSTGSGTFAFFSNGSWIINNEGEATLQVIDLNGRILSSETINGSVSKSINATTGIYMMRLISGDDVKTQKVVVR